jgi:hypothetical protein
VVLGGEQREVGIPVLPGAQVAQRPAHAGSRGEQARAGADAGVGGVGQAPSQRLGGGRVESVVRRLAAQLPQGVADGPVEDPPHLRVVVLELRDTGPAQPVVDVVERRVRCRGPA